MAELLGGRYVAQGASRPTAYGTAVRAGRAGTGTPVTVELLDPRLLADPAARARLAEGADRLRAASGRHLVQVLEVWAPDGAVVHDRFPGVSVAGLRSQAGGVLPADRAGALVADVLDGLAALHAAGLVHGALTEHDVLLDDATPLRSEVRLTGYGLAALLGPPYGLPDVPGGSGTPAADVWAAGALLALLATGSGPGAPLPAPLAGVAAALLADDPDGRPSAGQARDRLRAAVGLAPPAPGPGAGALPVAPGRARIPLALVLTGVAMAVAVSSGAVALTGHGGSQAPQASAALVGAAPTPASPTVQSYAFPPLRRADGLVVRRIWTLGPDGRSLHGETVVTNPTGGAVRAGIDEVLPASVVAREQDVVYRPRPDSQVPGRAARYLVDGLAPGGRRAWAFDARLPGRVTTVDGLAALVADAEAARLAYEERLRLAGARVVRLTVSPLQLRAGQRVTVAVSGRLADGRVLPAAALAGLVLRSSDSAVLAVEGTTARAVAPGAARLLAAAGQVRAIGLVTVAPALAGPSGAPGPAPARRPGASPSAVPAVVASPPARPTVAPAPTRAPSPSRTAAPRPTRAASPTPAASPTRAPRPTPAASPTRAPRPSRTPSPPPGARPSPAPSVQASPASPSPQGQRPQPRPTRSPRTPTR